MFKVWWGCQKTNCGEALSIGPRPSLSWCRQSVARPLAERWEGGSRGAELAASDPPGHWADANDDDAARTYIDEQSSQLS